MRWQMIPPMLIITTKRQTILPQINIFKALWTAFSFSFSCLAFEPLLQSDAFWTTRIFSEKGTLWAARNCERRVTTPFMGPRGQKHHTYILCLHGGWVFVGFFFFLAFYSFIATGWPEMGLRGEGGRHELVFYVPPSNPAWTSPFFISWGFRLLLTAYWLCPPILCFTGTTTPLFLHSWTTNHRNLAEPRTRRLEENLEGTSFPPSLGSPPSILLS